MTSIALIPLGALDSSVLQYLLMVLPDHTGMPCRVVDAPALNLQSAFLPERQERQHDHQQYHSTRMLELLEKVPAGSGALKLGLTELDLCLPIFTFVFGEAVLGGDRALVSLHRLHQRFYGLPEDSDLLLKRAEKECLHELGHTAGLIHCNDYSCVMHFSNSVEQVDIKEASFCDPCRLKFDQFLAQRKAGTASA